MIMTEKLLTEREAEIQKRNAAIRSDYAKYRAQFPEASVWRICTQLSRKYRLSAMQIRNLTK